MLSINTTPPTIPENAVRRDGLITKISGALNKKLVLITAGAGWGKTTLLSYLIKTGGHIFIWYRMDASDRDYAHFLFRLTQAVSETVAETRPRLNAVHRKIQDNEAFRYELCRETLNAIHATKKDVVLVFDDYHYAGDNAQLRRVFIQLLNDSPLNLHCVISTRENPDLPIGRIESFGEVARFTNQEFRFSKTEIKEYFSKNFGFDLSTHQAGQVLKRTEGWPVALRLVGETVSHTNDFDAAIRSNYPDSAAINNFFGEQIFQDLPLKTKEFLLKTSVFESFNARLCEAVFGLEGSTQRIGFLVENNFFLSQIGEHGESYRYHALYREFLNKRLLAEYGESATRKLHGAAAEYFAGTGDHDRALYHFVEAKNHDGAIQALVDSSETRFEQGAAEDFLRWSGKIPPDRYVNNPKMLFLLGWAQSFVGMLQDSKRTLEEALRVSQTQGDATTVGKSLYHLLMVLFFMDDYDRIVSLTEQILSAIDEGSAEYANICTYRAMSLMNLGRPQESKAYWDIVRDLDVVKNNFDVYMNTVPLMSFNYYYFMGDLEAGVALTEKALNHFRKKDIHGRYARYHIFLCGFYLEFGRYDAAAQMAGQGLSELRRQGQILPFVVCCGFLAICEALRGDLRAAADAVRDGDAVLTSLKSASYWKNVIFVLGKAFLAFKQDDAAAFFRDAGLAENLVLESGKLFDYYFVLTMLGPCYSFFGRHKKAIALLEDALQAITVFGRGFMLARTKVLLASAYFDAGNIDGGLAHFDDAIRIGAERNYDFLFLDREKVHAAKLLPLTLNRDFETAFVVELLVRLNGHTAEPVLPVLNSDNKDKTLIVIEALADLRCRDAEKHLNDLAGSDDTKIRHAARAALKTLRSLPPLPLKISFFGSFCIFVGNRLVSEKAWPRKPAKSILKFLVLHHDKDVSIDRLLESFFGDYAPGNAKRLLLQSMSVVRRALEPGITPKRKSSYLSSREGSYRLILPAGSSVDLFSFLDRCEEAETALHCGDADLAHQLFLSAIRIFHDDLLADELYEDWCTDARDRASQVLIRALSVVGRSFLSQCEFEKAAECFAKITKEDPFNEEAYVSLMESYSGLGNRAKTIKTFLDYEALFSKELGISPNREATALYHLAKASK